jgi:hypothetical protein
MKHRRKQSGPWVEPLEGRALLSTASLQAAVVPASLVRGFSYLYVNGAAHGTVGVVPTIPDAGTGVKLHGSAKLSGIGKASLSGTLSGTGFIMQGNASGTITLTNHQGSVILRLTGPSQRGFSAAPSGPYGFYVAGGTGHYAHTVGHGTVDVSYNSHTFSLSFHGGPNNA